MDQKQQRKAAKQFSKDWEGRGYEKGDTHAFWLELLRKVVGITGVATKCKFEYHAANGGFIDCYIPDCKTLIEQKALGVDLDKPEERQGRQVTPYQQALSYAQSFPYSQQPRFIIVSDFASFRIHDRNKQDAENDYIEFKLANLSDHFTQFDFMVDPEFSRSALEEQVSMKAGELIGKLHKELLACYIDPDSAESQHSLNVLCVRLVFCLYCEDADLFEKDAFLNYLKPIAAPQMREALKKLFKVLNTPQDSRDPYDGDVNRFPYVNGGLFAEEVEIPNFTDELRYLLLFEASQMTDWSKISPTIFGGIFESTLNPETRRAGGMHYTSPENIHKVIDPLFLDELKDEFNAILIDPELTGRKRKNRLKAFRDKIGSMRFFDPACGSGNFLTETYLCLRELEDDVINALNDGQIVMVFDEGLNNDERVSLDQFYGIEINDFAVRVAKTALWIAQLQADRNSETLFNFEIDRFPLSDSANIILGNALELDWQDVLPAHQCNIIMGNPPFYGAANLTRQQAQEIKRITNCGVLDYVAGWYYIASQYANNHKIKIAFVSTNSICQGEQPEHLWKVLFENGWHIAFAHQTFKWRNDAAGMAHVHVVIIGLSNVSQNNAVLYKYKTIDDEPEEQIVNNINGYLQPSPNYFVTSRSKPVCEVPSSNKGSSPTDDGNLIISSREELELVLSENPGVEKYIRQYYGAEEFLNGLERWCLWMPDFDPQDMRHMPGVKRRLDKCREYRASRTRVQTNRAQATPWLFVENRQPSTDYLIIPRHSSERRKWIPFGFVPPDVIASDATQVVPCADLFMFGVLSSTVHNAWMRIVCGRLKSDYRYSVKVVYNNFIWPTCDDAIKTRIAECAKKVLDAREQYPSTTLAELYDPDNIWLFQELQKAHEQLDAAVESAYGLETNSTEEEIVAHLFKLYAAAIEG